MLLGKSLLLAKNLKRNTNLKKSINSSEFNMLIKTFNFEGTIFWENFLINYKDVKTATSEIKARSLYKNDGINLLLIEFHNQTFYPPHNHPDMIVLSKVLKGNFKIKRWAESNKYLSIL